MSSAPRSRREGTKRTSKLSRSSRSGLNLPSSAIAHRSALVAATIRTSTATVSLAPTRSKPPYSTTRRIFSCTAIGIWPISSRKSVPPCAASNRPARRRAAPVNAPASWPKSSLSKTDGDSAAQLSLTNGPPQRGDRKCTRSAASSLPVPRSPMSRTGRWTLAMRASCCWKSRKRSDLPRPSRRLRSLDATGAAETGGVVAIFTRHWFYTPIPRKATSESKNIGYS